jgi:hypothetical protein
MSNRTVNEIGNCIMEGPNDALGDRQAMGFCFGSAADRGTGFLRWRFVAGKGHIRGRCGFE